MRSQIQVNYETLVTFFPIRYRGSDPQIGQVISATNPLLLQPSLEQLSAADSGLSFSGATCASAAYVLERRLGLQSPVLIAMEDALES